MIREQTRLYPRSTNLHIYVHHPVVPVASSHQESLDSNLTHYNTCYGALRSDAGATLLPMRALHATPVSDDLSSFLLCVVRHQRALLLILEEVQISTRQEGNIVVKIAYHLDVHWCFLLPSLPKIPAPMRHTGSRNDYPNR